MITKTYTKYLADMFDRRYMRIAISESYKQITKQIIIQYILANPHLFLSERLILKIHLQINNRDLLIFPRVNRFNCYFQSFLES